MDQWMTLDGRGGLDKSGLLGPNIVPSEDEANDFYLALGRAISAWQNVETSLYAIASSAIHAENTIALGALFHSQVMFKGRLESVSAVIPLLTITQKLKDKWKGLYKELRTSSESRNGFAHGQTFFDPTRLLGQRMFVSGNFWHHKYWGKVGLNGDGTTADMLKEHKQAFDALQTKVWSFSAALTDELKPAKATNQLKSYFDNLPWGQGQIPGLLAASPAKKGQKNRRT